MTEVPTRIGVIVSSLHEPCQSLLWKGVYRAARARGVEVVTFVATSQDRVDSLDMHFQVVRDFALNSHLDGLILFAGAIAEFVEEDFLQKLCAELLALPMVSLSYEVPGAACILPDNASGVAEMVDHFINHHGYRNIAFVKGPPGHGEAEARFDSYRKALDSHHIEYNPALVLEGNFSARSGVNAVRSLYSSRTPFDAVMCVDDETAIGAISELKKRGVHIPTDVAVAGFDDIADASIVLPSLSTIKQPLFQMGGLALETIVQKLRGETVPAVEVLPTTAVYRRSCGCFPSTIRESTPPSDPLSAFMNRDELLVRIRRRVGNVLGLNLFSPTADELILRSLRAVVESFEKNIEQMDARNPFLNALDMYLFRVDGLAGDIESMQALLIELSMYVNALDLDHQHSANGNNLLQQAQVLLREHKLRATQTRNMEEAAFQLKIRETSQKIITTFDQSRLRYTISEEFPHIHINRFVFALYDQASVMTTDRWRFPSKSRVVVGFDHARGIAVPEEHSEFDSADLFPAIMRPADGTPLYPIFMPLFFKDEQFGYVLFDYTDDQPFFMYEELRLHIGSSLKSSLLMQELKIQSMVDELTGLYNRRGFVTLSQKMIESAQQAGGRLLVFYADLDGLKQINDHFGHDEGDAALTGAAQVLTDTFRRKDVIARMGGDEFTVIIHIGDNAEPESRILLRMRDKIDDFNRYGGRPFSLSMSVGSSYFEPDSGKSLDDILKEADNRMMAKKRRHYEG